MQLTLMEKTCILSWRDAKASAISCTTILSIAPTFVVKERRQAFTTGNAFTIARSVAVAALRPSETSSMWRTAMVSSGSYTRSVWDLFPYSQIALTLYSSAQPRSRRRQNRRCESEGNAAAENFDGRSGRIRHESFSQAGKRRINWSSYAMNS